MGVVSQNLMQTHRHMCTHTSLVKVSQRIRAERGELSKILVFVRCVPERNQDCMKRWCCMLRNQVLLFSFPT